MQEIRLSPTGIFAVRLDESTDVSSCAQLLVFVMYVLIPADENLFFTQLETTTKALDVMKNLTSFYTASGTACETFRGICTDGAPAMLGFKLRLQKHVKETTLTAKVLHCMIHCFALVSKILPDELCKIF